MSGYDNPYGGYGNGVMRGQVNSGTAPAAGHVKDTTTAGFMKDVIEESRNQPVLVDFWAPWCGPCKQLAPVIEKVVAEAGGRVKLVKLNIDDHPAIPGQLGVQSIPAVIAFVDGRPVDGFMGAVPESQVRQFIDKIAGPEGADQAAEIAGVLEEADQLLADGDFNSAGQLYGAVMQADPENPKAIAGIARCMIAAGQQERARELLDQIGDELKADADIQSVIKKLEQFEEARKLGNPAELEHKLALDPDDHESRMKLAKILNVQGNRDEAADHLLLIMRKDRTFGDDAARRQLLEFFDAWGFKDPATIAARRKLSTMLFS